MSDRIKKIKIKQSDGTFSDYIPIGADAKNIDTTRGESVQSVIDKTARYYNSIAEMKLDDNIQVGDTCVTLGYYEVNDGGSGTYKIVDDSSLEDDGGSVHELNNGLKAKLIIKDNQINVKQFGAYGDGEHDDSEYIQKAVDYCDKNIILNNFYSKKSTFILFTNGKYIIDNSIIIPYYIKIKIDGVVVLLSNVANGTTLKFVSNNTNKPSGYPYLYNCSFIDGDLVGGNGILVIQRSNGVQDINSENQSVGISIGDDSSNNYINIARCKINNITISGFKKALNINCSNVYLITFNNLHIENNNIGVYFNGETQNNSGENISFNNCIFSHCYHAIFMDASLSGLNFYRCSFDFNSNDFLENYITNNIISTNGCHFEGVGFSDNIIQANEDNTEGFSYIFFNNVVNRHTKPIFTLNDAFIHTNTFNSGVYKFGTVKTENNYTKNLLIKLNTYSLSFLQNRINFNNKFFADDNTEIEMTAPNISNGVLPYLDNSNDEIGKFIPISNEYNGNYLDNEIAKIINDYGYKIEGNSWSSQPINVSIDTDDKVFTKSLVVEQKAPNAYCTFSRAINGLNKNYISTIIYFNTKNVVISNENEFYSRMSIRFNFYDYNDNLLGTDNQTVFESDVSTLQTQGDWMCFSALRKIPNFTYRCEIKCNVSIRDISNNSPLSFTGPIKFGGFIIKQMN